jgi:hypothetical protein
MVPPPRLETEIFGAKTTGMSWAGLVVVILLAGSSSKGMNRRLKRVEYDK